MGIAAAPPTVTWHPAKVIAQLTAAMSTPIRAYLSFNVWGRNGRGERMPRNALFAMQSGGRWRLRRERW
jgi:hypothetical protein